jgi:4-amino-4-deoxy-L-arabinose transferase-like glycosyltransferase
VSLARESLLNELITSIQPVRLRELSVALLIAVGAFLRLYALDRYPLPMHQDELASVYDGYSLAETGADRTGAPHPFIIRGSGAVDYRPALYAWLAAVPLRFLGFSPLAGRLPSAVLGTLSLVLLYAFARRFAGPTFALLALLFAALSPWHILFSRIAHQGSALPGFFLILSLWLWLRCAQKNYPPGQLGVLAFAIGVSANAHYSSRLIAPLLALLVFIDLLSHAPNRRKSAAVFVLACLVGALPQLWVMLTEPEHFFVRLRVTQLSAGGKVPMIAEVLHNFSFVVSPRLLFWPTMEDTGMTAARLIPAEIAVYYLGILTFSKLMDAGPSRFRVYIYLVATIALLPGIITANSSSIRFAAVVPLLPLFSAAGAMWLGEQLQKLGIPRAFYYSTGTIATLGTFSFTAWMYLASPKANGQRSNNVIVQVGQKLATLGARYDSVFVVDSPLYAAYHVVAFSGMRPSEYQAAPKVITLDAKGWDYVRQVGKYQFLPPRELPDRLQLSLASPQRSLFVLRVPPPGVRVVDSVAWFEDKYYFAEPIINR